MNYLRMAGVVILFLCVFTFPQFFLGMFLGIRVVFTETMQNMDYSPELIQQQINQYLIHILIISSLVSLLLFWLYFKIKNAITGSKERILQYCRFHIFTGKQFVLALLMGGSLYFIINGIIYFSRITEILPGYQEHLAPLYGHHVIITLIVTGLLVPLVEEIAFRGMIFNRLRQDLPMIVALILQAFLFGLVHFNLLQSSYAFVLGMIWGLAYFFTGSFWVPFVAHLSFNALSAVMVQLVHQELTASHYVLFSAGGVIVFLVTLILITLQHQQSSPEWTTETSFE